MNLEPDVDQILRAWLDEGPEVAPERAVWSALDDIEHTDQRPRWRASLEGILMRALPAAPILVVVAIVLAALAAFVVTGGPNVRGPASTPTPRAFTTQDLRALTGTAVTPEGVALDEVTTGTAALVAGLPANSVIDQTGFLDARYTQNSGPAGAVATWAAVFETATDASRAYAFVVARHEATDGWGLEPSPGGAELGDASVSYSGAAYGFDRATIYLWRVNNLLLAAIGVVDTDPTIVRGVADAMDAQSR